MKILLLFCLWIFGINFCLAKNFSSLNEKVDYFKNRYKVECLNEKIIDNFGNGFDNLYGTRNMRPILLGIAYRGGANNYYHKTNKRDNQNPLPNDGLENLNNEGFSMAVYLYGKNFSTAPRFVTNNNNDTLRYIQNSGMNRNTQREIMQMVQDRIENPSLGPVYLHCWNGWHQCGYISAIILMQYCGFTNAKAREYWEINTDGAHKKFENVKTMIANFTPFKEFAINKEMQEVICPCFKK